MLGPLYPRSRLVPLDPASLRDALYVLLAPLLLFVCYGAIVFLFLLSTP